MDPHQDGDASEEERAGDAQGSAEQDDVGSEKTEHEDDADRADDAGAGEDDEAKEEMKRIEEDPPENLEDWPQGKAKYETYGGPEGTHSYHEGPEQKLGPSSLRHHEGGEVSIEGDKVDDPDEYKGDPIPGGPTDPDAPDQPGERDLEQGREGAEDSGDSESEDSEEAPNSSDG